MPVQKISQTVPYLKVLIYGDSGAGKTWLAGSAADVEAMRPVLFVDLESGVLSIRDRDVDLLPVRSHADLQELSDLISNPSPEDGEDEPYRTVVIDSLTELYALNMEIQLRAEQRPNAVPELRDWLQCVSEGSRIFMADGSEKPIESIVPGDVVLGLSQKNHCRLVPTVVDRVILQGEKPCVKVNNLRLTADHRVMTREDTHLAWRTPEELATLNSGPEVVQLSTVHKREKILGHQVHSLWRSGSLHMSNPKKRQVYDLTTGTGNFFAEGILVHNCTNKMRRFLRFVRQQPIHFITTCQARVLDDELTGAVSRVPDLPGKLAGQVGHFFDIVGYIKSSLDRSGETVTRTLQVQPYRRVSAKDRTGQFGVAVEDPTMAKLYSAITEE
jgi:hypothetical protein